MPTKYAGSCHCGDVAFEADRQLISHKFCKRCGIQPFSFATDQKGNKMAAVNARTLEGIDLSGLPKREFNGRAR